MRVSQKLSAAETFAPRDVSLQSELPLTLHATSGVTMLDSRERCDAGCQWSFAPCDTSPYQMSGHEPLAARLDAACSAADTALPMCVGGGGQ